MSKEVRLIKEDGIYKIIFIRGFLNDGQVLKALDDQAMCDFLSDFIGRECRIKQETKKGLR